MPIDSQIIKFDYQKGMWDIFRVWAIVDADKPLCVRRFSIYGTGFEIDPGLNLKHIETILIDDRYVWHLFEVLPDEL